MNAATWDESVDILVVGSGAGALTAALRAALSGASVLVIEKSDLWGGSSATSGGGIWIPDSHLAQQAGITDSIDAAFSYVRALSADNVPDTNISAFVQSAARMLRWLEDNTPVRYLSIPYTDYHAELPGGKAEGFRTHLPKPMDGRLLGDAVQTLRPASPAASLFGRINWDFTETNLLLHRPKGWSRTLLKMLARYYLDFGQRLRSSKDRYLTLGNALIGGLRIATDRAGVAIWLNAPLTELVRENGAVTGAIVSRNGNGVRVAAKRAVILAAGGFEQNPQMRKQYLKVADPVLSGGQVNNTGDAIRVAMEIGAATMNMDSVWWAPVFSLPGEDRGRLSTIERALPGGIIVNQAGQRFMNEAASYHLAGMRMSEADAPGRGTNPSFMIFDATFRHRYPVGPLLPLLPDWLQARKVRSVMTKAPTIVGLAAKIGVPADTLEKTVRIFNELARRGEDPEFHRGEAAYDRFYGDPRATPNPCLAPIETPPFYAFPIHPGDIGTNGGLATDEHARVLDSNGAVIAGLYAVGNTAASVMGRSYPGAGSTLGPAMTFGYLAAGHATGANA
jgi:3-oxosteroid 1-dehydrogenase